MEEKEVELIDYLIILWKRKWLIVIGALSCIIIALAVSFLLKPVYEIDTLIQPGKLFIEIQAGNFEEFVVESPQQIADKVIHKSYDRWIAAELNLDATKFPELRAENIKDTLLTRIWIRDTEVSQAKRVLEVLVSLIQEELDKKIDIEIANIDSSINASEIEKERRAQEIDILNKKLHIVDQRKKDITHEMASVKTKISELEKEQREVLKKESRSEIESLGLLLYSNEIQQSLQYYDLLNEKLSEERLKEEDINSDLQNERATINKIDNTIANLKERKGRIDKTKVVKEPTSSIYPVSPKKKSSALVACVIGLMIFTMLAFILEYVERKRSRNQV